MDTLSSIIQFKTLQDKLLFTALSAGVWYGIFFACIKLIHLPKYDKRTAVNIKQKLVALIYDLIVLFGPLYLYLSRGIPKELNDDPKDNFLLLESCGYYIAHFIVVTKYRITHKGQVVHHILTVLTIFAGAYNNVG